MKTIFITAIYSNLHGTEFGGRPSRGGHYKWSLLSLLKMTDAEFVCYIPQEQKEELTNFFYNEYKISNTQLQFVEYDLSSHDFKNLFEKYKNVEEIKKGDRCLEIQYMKFMWFTQTINKHQDYDYCYWIDAGLSHCGIIADKYLAKSGVHGSQYYESSLFNNQFLKNLNAITRDKITIIGKENIRNYWASTVDPVHYTEYNKDHHIIGGLFGGKKQYWQVLQDMFVKYVYQVAEHDHRIYHEENIMCLMYANHKEFFNLLTFDTWWHEDSKIPGLDMIEHTTQNKSFYKILEELNVPSAIQ